MKKQTFIFILICFISLIFIITTTAYSASEAGRVLAVKKKAYIIRDEVINDAKTKMPLLVKDAVETDKDSRTKLFFTDDSILNLGELSRVEVEEYLYSSEQKRSKSLYRLIDGSLRVVVGRSDLEVHTVTAVAASRGTKFVIWTESINRITENKMLDSNNLLASSSKNAGDYIFADRVKSFDKYNPVTKSCIYVLSGNVSLKNKRPDLKGEITVNEGTMGCVTIDDLPRIEPGDRTVVDKFNDDTMVLGPLEEDKDILILPARVVEYPGFVDPFDDSYIPQNPVPEQQPVNIPDFSSEVNVEVIFPK